MPTSPDDPHRLPLENEGGFDLWQEHSRALKSWDDLFLSRWINQVLGLLHERCWRASHPLAVAFRLAAGVAHQRDLWNRRTTPQNEHYEPAPCCGAPLLPFISFEVYSHGLYCAVCGEILRGPDELPPDLGQAVKAWGGLYDPIHQVAHWSDEERRRCGDFDKALDKAFEKALPLLGQLGYRIAPRFLPLYPCVIWEDGDNCLDIIPEDIQPPEDKPEA